MAGAVHQLHSCPTLAAGEHLDLSCQELWGDSSKRWDNGSNKRSPYQPDFKHKVITEPLQVDIHEKPSWSTYQLIRRQLVADQCIEAAGATDSFPPSLIWACCKRKDLSRGTRLHDELQRRGFTEKKYSDALVTMYAQCGELQKAHALLERHNSSSVVPWTALITSYARHGQGQNALNCFEQMRHEGISPNAVTYVGILKACAVMGAIDVGKHIHDEISRQGLLSESVILGGALVDMYAKCGDLLEAQSALKKLPSRNVFTWNALIGGYAQREQGQQALECVKQMQQDGVPPDAVTYVCILKACAAIGDIEEGKQIHDEILRQGFLEHNILLGCALVDMYAKCGALLQAQSVLEKLPSRNAVSWNALIGGYAQRGQGLQALKCFKQMQNEGITPDAVTYVCILKACAAIGDFDMGKKIHNEVLRQGLVKESTELGNALVDMYAKCGDLPQAQSILEKIPSRNVVSWNTLIAGYVQKGLGEQAFECFRQMQHEGILPSRVTFICLLNLCSHIGLVEKGQEIFDSMEAKYGVKPDLKCFTCMSDILGRSGHLIKAVEVIQEMPFSPNSMLWRCLLGACRKWVNVSVGTWAFEHAVELDKCDERFYLLMMNLYSAAGMPEKAKAIEALRIKNKAWKKPGHSLWSDLDITLHELRIDDTKHVESKERLI